MLTTRSSSVNASPLCASMNATRAFSSADNPPCAEATEVIATHTRKTAKNLIELLFWSLRFGSLRVGVWSFERFGSRLLYSAQLTANQGHGTEGGLAELSRIYPDRPFQVIGQRLPRCRTANHVRQPRQIGKAH